MSTEAVVRLPESQSCTSIGGSNPVRELARIYGRRRHVRWGRVALIAGIVALASLVAFVPHSRPLSGPLFMLALGGLVLDIEHFVGAYPRPPKVCGGE